MKQIRRRLKIMKSLLEAIIDDSDEEFDDSIIPLYEQVWK
jgi:hypothetical protein